MKDVREAYREASWLSHISYSWATSLVKILSQKEVVVQDLWRLKDSDTVEVAFGQLNAEWNKELEKPGDKRSFKSAILRMVHRDIVITFFIQLFYIGCAITTPAIFIPQLLIANHDVSVPVWIGVALSIGFALATLGRSLGQAQQWIVGTLAGMRVRSATSTLIYKKMGRLLPGSMPAGEVVNLVSVDCARLAKFGQDGIFLTSTPVILTFVLIALLLLLGKSALIGFGLLLVLVPVQGWIGRRAGTLRRLVAATTDRRIRLMDEVLRAAKLIKLYSWEKQFAAKVAEVRSQEMKIIRQTEYLLAVNSMIAFTGPGIVSFTTFVLYYFIEGKNVPVGPAFAALGLFNFCRFSLESFPNAQKTYAEVLVACRRIETFLLLPEISDKDLPKHLPMTEDKSEPVIDFQGVTYRWHKTTPVLRPTAATGKGNQADGNKGVVVVPTAVPASPRESKVFEIADINLQVYPGELVAIVGHVGAGKSSLLSSLLGSMSLEAGIATMRHNKGLALVEQQPWIFNSTLRENILFGQAFDEVKYNAVVESSALRADLDILPAGDMTEIGERGINLSGGQKARVSLARAMYAEPDIYLLDDPLSAVDAHVGNHLFHEGIRGQFMKGRTILLVTHQLQFIDSVDKIIVMKHGTIAFCGNYESLCQNKKLFDELGLNNSETSAAESEAEDLAEAASPKAVKPVLASSSATSGKGDATTVAARAAGMKLIRAEDRAVGAVSSAAWRRWVKALGGTVPVFLLVFSFVLAIGVKMGSDWWISIWLGKTPIFGFKFDDTTDAQYLQMLIYGIFALVAIVLNMISRMGYATFNLRASSRVHDSVFATLLRATPAFFDSTPIGVLLNRFSSDMDQIDTTLLSTSQLCFVYLVQSTLSLVLIAVIFPAFLILLIPLALIFAQLIKTFRKAIQQVKRMESISKSPLIGHFQATMEGLLSVNAFNKAEPFIQKNALLMDTSARAYFAFCQVNRWFGIRTDLLTTVICTAVALFTILGRSFVSPGMAGLALTYAIATGGMFQYGARLVTETEAIFTSVERLTFFEDSTPLEAAASTEEDAVIGESWPANGEIVFDNLSVQYKVDLPCVLEKVSVTIPARQRVAVVGRTGSGKTTLSYALWRMLEPVEGTIHIDGVDITKVGLSSLRSKLAVIPQTPTLFIGTIRTNLDPFNNSTDDAVWGALEQVQMKDFVSSLPLGLNADVKEGGENFSVGQRQLFCFCRALLRGSKIILMDEATASVDQKTDAMIQAAMEAAFTNHTVIIIAHRLNTVMSCDKILVLDKGHVAEFGKPSELVDREDSYFAALVNKTGIENAKRLRALIRS